MAGICQQINKLTVAYTKRVVTKTIHWLKCHFHDIRKRRLAVSFFIKGSDLSIGYGNGSMMGGMGWDTYISLFHISVTGA